MAGISTDIDAVRMLKNRVLVTVKIKRLREVRLRFRIAALLIRVAAWVMPGDVRIEESE